MGGKLESIHESLRAALQPDLSPRREPLPYLEGIVDQMAEAFKGLLPHIQNAEYSLIIGDAESGTIPTLVWKRIIDAAYKGNGIPETSMVLVDRGEMDPIPPELVEEITHFVNEAKSLRPDTKALITTEHMGSGKHVQDLAKILTNLGMDYDVAAITMRATPGYYKNMGDYPLSERSEIFFGGFAQRNAISDLPEDKREEGIRNVPTIASTILFLHSLQKETKVP